MIVVPNGKIIHVYNALQLRVTRVASVLGPLDVLVFGFAGNRNISTCLVFNWIFINLVMIPE